VPGESARHPNRSTLSGALNDDLLGTKPNRDLTTVRIRGKDHLYRYAEGSFAHPLQSLKNDQARKHAYSTLQSSHAGSPRLRQASEEERERVHALLLRYKEEKINKEIQRIEYERQQAELERQAKRQEQVNLKRYNEQLKERLAQHQQVKF
jgi:hypothetical protein